MRLGWSRDNNRLWQPIKSLAGRLFRQMNQSTLPIEERWPISADFRLRGRAQRLLRRLALQLVSLSWKLLRFSVRIFGVQP